jgi:hypothetical protein
MWVHQDNLQDPGDAQSCLLASGTGKKRMQKESHHKPKKERNQKDNLLKVVKAMNG